MKNYRINGQLMVNIQSVKRHLVGLTVRLHIFNEVAENGWDIHGMQKALCMKCVYWETDRKLFISFYYAPNFKEVDGAYWFRVVRPCVREEPCMLEFWNFIYGFLMEK